MHISSNSSNVGHLAEYNFFLPLFTRHLTLSHTHFTMQTTQETKSSISSSVYGIQQLFRDFEKQCHILTKPATEGTLATPTLLLVDLIQPTPSTKRDPRTRSCQY